MQAELTASASLVRTLSHEELANLKHLADLVLQDFRSQKNDSNFDAQSVRMMSNMVDLNRAAMARDRERLPSIANMFGAFLGTAMIECSAGMPTRWIRTEQEIGVEVICGDHTARFFPISRVFRQIEFGGARSIWSMYQTLVTLLQQLPKDERSTPAAEAPRAGPRPAAGTVTESAKVAEATGPQPVSQEDMVQIEKQADRTVQFYRKHVQDFDYDARSVKIMSDHLDKQREKLLADPAKLKNIAIAYGAYLGKVILACNPQWLSRWIRSGDEIGIEIVRGSSTFHAFTVSRILKQVESGEQTAWQMLETFQSLGS